MDEFIRVISKEANALGPLKLSLTMQIELIKDTNRGEEKVKYYTRQDNPMILNAFSTQTAKEKLNAELDKIAEKLANWDQDLLSRESVKPVLTSQDMIQ